MRGPDFERLGLVDHRLDPAPGARIDLTGVQADLNLRAPGRVLDDLQPRLAELAGDVQRQQAVERRRAAFAQVLTLLHVVAPLGHQSSPGRRLPSRPATWKVATLPSGSDRRSSRAPARSRQRSRGLRSDSTGAFSAVGRDAGTLVSAPPSIEMPTRQPLGHSIGPGRPSTRALPPQVGSSTNASTTWRPSSVLPAICAVAASPSSPGLLPYSQRPSAAAASAIVSASVPVSASLAAAGCMAASAATASTASAVSVTAGGGGIAPASASAMLAASGIGAASSPRAQADSATDAASRTASGRTRWAWGVALGVMSWAPGRFDGRLHAPGAASHGSLRASRFATVTARRRHACALYSGIRPRQ